jgi:hypothetical protein
MTMFDAETLMLIRMNPLLEVHNMRRNQKVKAICLLN